MNLRNTYFTKAMKISSLNLVWTNDIAALSDYNAST